MTAASIAEKFSGITEHWRPKVVAELNGQEVKLVKFQGEFPWHHHGHEDEIARSITIRPSSLLARAAAQVSRSAGGSRPEVAPAGTASAL
jgi:hypothetical protein